MQGRESGREQITVFAVRGAVQLRQDSPAEMAKQVQTLVAAVLNNNEIVESEVVSIQFTQTADLSSENPARALRKAGYSQVPLFCSLEPQYPGQLPRVVRVLVTFRSRYRSRQPIPAYLNGAEQLRPDLADNRER